MTPLMKAVVFCFCPESLPDSEGVHVSDKTRGSCAHELRVVTYAQLLLYKHYAVFVLNWM